MVAVVSHVSNVVGLLDVLDVKCLSFNIEPQHIGISSIKFFNIAFRQLIIRCIPVSNESSL